MQAIVLIYLAGMLAVGWWCHRSKISTMADYLIAGRKLGLTLCAGAMTATHFGGGALLGGAEYGFNRGWSGAWYGIATAIGMRLLGLLMARRFRALALFTVPDYLRQRYGSGMVPLLAAVLSIVALVGILAAQVKAAGAAFAIIGIGGWAAPVLATLVFIVYATLGGLWAATISDLFQIAIAAIGLVIASYTVLANAGGFNGLMVRLAARVPPGEHVHLLGSDPTWVLWIVLPTVMYTLIGQDFYQRLFAARNESTARNAASLASFLLLLLSFAPVLVGMGARALGPDSLTADQALPWVLQQQLPPVIGGVVLAAVLAAVMSTADSLLTAATSHWVNDIWLQHFSARERYSERDLLLLSRLSTIFVGLAALALGTMMRGIVNTLIYSYTVYTAAVFVPVLGGVLWKGGTLTGARFAILAGVATAVFGLFTQIDLGGVPVEVYAAGVSLVAYIVGSLIRIESK